MDVEEIQRRVTAFPRWQYEFDLQGVITPIHNPAHRNRHRQRVAYFFDPVVGLCGGSLRNKRVLDLSCNAGFWCLEAIKAGADFVQGIDRQPVSVDQSNFVFEALGVDTQRYNFAVRDAVSDDLTDLGSFDVVLCLGFLYHIARPMELFANMAHVSSDLFVLDTGVSRLPGRVIELRDAAVDDSERSGDTELVGWPTPRAVMAMLAEFGYSTIALEPRMDDYEGMTDYMTGNRYAFVAAKHTDLSPLDAVSQHAAVAKLDRVRQVSTLAARSGATATKRLARPGVKGRSRVVGDLGAAYRRFTRR